MFDASLESLESRRLLSVTLEQGVLTVTGTEQADQLAVGRNQTMIVVNDNGTASQWNPAEVTSIVVNGLDGNDQIAILPGVIKPIAINAGLGNDAVQGGPGRERIFGGAGEDMLRGGGGGDLMEGGEDNDRIVGGAGPDHMIGNAGNDHFDAVDRDQDLLDGGEGEDWARISRGDHARNIEHVLVVRPSMADVAPASSADKDLINDLMI
ncbi:MAG: hypothetical protein H7Z14_03390 [Anaerolineae bacterium]|nr:hypothetical protein [Phycisphaerae bacterium]